MIKPVTLVVASTLSRAVEYCRTKVYLRELDTITNYRDGDRLVLARAMTGLTGYQADEIIIVDDGVISPYLFTRLAHGGTIRVDTNW